MPAAATIAAKPSRHRNPAYRQHAGRADCEIRALEVDLATEEGVDQLYDVIETGGAPVEILVANAGRGLGHGFLDQEFAEARRVIDTNIVGTIYLVQK